MDEDFLDNPLINVDSDYHGVSVGEDVRLTSLAKKVMGM
jgi:hypothetical protein